MPSNKVIEPTKWFEVIVDLKTAKQTQRPGAGGSGDQMTRDDSRVGRAREKGMKRKVTLLTLCCMLLALSFSVEAQQTGKVYRLGYLTNASEIREDRRRHSEMRCASLGTSKGGTLRSNGAFLKGSSIGFPILFPNWSISNWTALLLSGGSDPCRQGSD